MNRRSLFIITALLLLLAPLAAGFGPPRQGGDDGPITITLDAGFSRRFRADAWLPLLLTVSNDGPDVRGALRVRSETNAGLNATTYSTPIDLPRQSRKQVFLYVSLQSYSRQILVELVAENGDVLATVGSQLLPARHQDILAAVVTDSPSGSVDLSSLNPGTGESYQVNWSTDHIPPLADALLSLNVMVFVDVDTGRLSVEQQQAIADWVLAGGHLIVAGGPNYRLTTAGLADLLPVTLSGTTTVDDLTPLAVFAGRYDDTLREPDVILAVGEPLPDAVVLVETEGQPLLTRRTYGEGLVDYLAADPGLAPFRRWGGAGALWETLVITPRQMPSWSEGFQDWQMAGRVVQQTPGFDLPTVLQICGLLAIYIAVIGPINYLVLRVLGRRELAWVTIPALVVVFSVLAYFTGFTLRGTQATINRLVMMQVWPGSSRAQVDALIGVLSPRRATYDLIMPEGLTLRPLPEESNPGGFAPVLASNFIEESTAFAAREMLVDASFVSGFTASGFIDDAPALDGQATLQYGQSTGARLTGELTNTTGLRLEDAVILARGAVQHLGTLEPGDAARFSLPVSSRQSAALSILGAWENLYFEGIDLTAQDVLGPRFNASRYYPQTPTLAERTARQRQDFIRAIAPDRDVSGGRGDRVFLLGWGDDSPFDVRLEGTGWLPADMTLYVFEIPVTVAQSDDVVRISPGFSTWFMLGDSTVLGATPYNLTVTGGEQVAFRFVPLPTAQLREVTQLIITARRSANTAGATVSLWDWQAGDWVGLDLAGDVRAVIDDPARFLGPSNAVSVRVVPDSLNGFVSYEQLDVTWYGMF